MIRLPDAFYVTGTDTDVGKTVASAALAAATGRAWIKPVQSGAPTDADRVRALTASYGVRVWPSPVALTQAKSPHAAAAAEGRRVALTALTRPEGPLVVEGVGGWLAPLATSPWTFQADLVRSWGLPVVVVARTGLGTLHHTLSTVRCARADGADLRGLVLVGDAHPENEADLPRLTGLPVLVRLPWADDVDARFPDLVNAARAVLS